MARWSGWLVALAVLGWLAADSLRERPAVEAAEAARDSLAVLAPLVDSLKVEAERRDTLLVQVTDTVRVAVTRERLVQVAVTDTIYAHVDSVGAVFLDSLIASEAREDVAQDRLQAETLAWGSSWKAFAEAQTLQVEQLTISSDEWERAYRSRDRQGWLERGGAALAVLGVLLIR